MKNKIFIKKLTIYIPLTIALIIILFLSLFGIFSNINLVSNSKIFGFGSNNAGQLGSLNIYKSPVEIQSIYLQNINDFDAGIKHTVYLMDNGLVYQQGVNGLSGEPVERYIEFKNDNGIIEKLNNIIAVSAGSDYSLALDSQGFVWSWGFNLTGQLATGNNESSIYAKKIEGLSNIIKISAGYKFALALNSSGVVYAWGGSCSLEKSEAAKKWLAQPTLKVGIGGYYDPTSLGSSDGVNLNNQAIDYNSYCANEYVIGFTSKTPLVIEDLPKITEISAGWGHSLLIDSDGFVWSFGCNLYNQLGPTLNHLKPFKITTLTNIISVSAGFRHSLALDNLGNVYSWGYNLRGSLGLGKVSESETLPQKLSVKNIKGISASHDFSILLDSNSNILIFGENNSGVVNGDLNVVYSPNPILKYKESQFNKISTGKSFVVLNKL